MKRSQLVAHALQGVQILLAKPAHRAEAAVQRLLAAGLQLHVCKATAGAGRAACAARFVARQLAARHRAEGLEAVREQLRRDFSVQAANVKPHHARRQAAWRHLSGFRRVGT